MITKEYNDIRFDTPVRIVATLTEEEYNTVTSMAQRYKWSEVNALMVLRNTRGDDIWERIVITYLGGQIFIHLITWQSGVDYHKLKICIKND